jgi:hypothetical protein
LVVSQTPSQQEQVLAAEILWALKVAESNYSYASCDGLPYLFRRMFPGQIPEHFTMSKSKISYLISDGIGPHYRRELCTYIRNTGTFFTLQYDETCNSQNKKQCDLLLRYWSEDTGQICVQFLKSLMFGHAKGKDVAAAILETLNEEGFQLPLKQLLSLGSDGPNVNKTIWTAINEHLKESALPGMLPFISCSLHVVHNAFRQGLNKYGENAEELVLDLFYFIKASPCRKEDLSETQLNLGLDEQIFIRHVQSRWLTLIPAVNRVLTIWEAVEQYFLRDLPKIDKGQEKSERYRRICRRLRDPMILVELHFLQSLESIFSPFLTLFQREEPLIHILHDQLSELVRRLLSRFIKSDAFGDKTGKELLSVEILKAENKLCDKTIEIGGPTRVALKKQVKKEQHSVPIKAMRQFFEVATQYLMDKLPLGREILKDLASLHPLLQKEECTVRAIKRTAQKVPQVIPKEELCLLGDEWKLYQSLDVPGEWVHPPSQGDGSVAFRRVDEYWKMVFKQKNALGMPKFIILPKFVKAVLCLAHGNAEVERSLSENKRVVTPERSSLSPESINALRSTKDAIRIQVSGQVHKMPLPSGLLQSAKVAHAVYKSRCEEEREKKNLEKLLKEKKQKEQDALQETINELDQKKRKLLDKEKVVIDKQKKHEKALKTAEDLYNEANKRLVVAIGNRNMDEVSVVQGLMEVAKKKTEEARSQLEKCRKEKEAIDAKRRKVLDNYSKTLDKFKKS